MGVLMLYGEVCWMIWNGSGIDQEGGDMTL